MLENTKLEAKFNGFQYLIIFFVGIFVDLVVHFFSQRKYKNRNAIGFAPELMAYYYSLCRKGPFTADSGTFYSYCNSWLLGALIGGIVAVVLLLLTDLILYIIETRRNHNL